MVKRWTHVREVVGSTLESVHFSHSIHRGGLCRMSLPVWLPGPMFLAAGGLCALSHIPSSKTGLNPGGSQSRGSLSTDSLSREVSIQGVSVRASLYSGMSVQGVSVKSGLNSGGLCPGDFSPRFLCTGCLHPERSRRVSVRGVFVVGNSNRETPLRCRVGGMEALCGLKMFQRSVSIKLIEKWLL